MRISGMGLVIVAGLAATAACQQALEPATAATTQDAAPSEILRATFTNCQWGEVRGSGLSVWSYACGPDSGNTKLVADDSLPGFAIEGTWEGQTSRRPAILIFRKLAEAPVESILEAVRAKSPGPNTASCTLQTVTYEGAVPGSVSLEPTGSVKVAWDAFSNGEADAAPVEPPCGDMGPQMDGSRAFRVLAEDPTTVVFIEYGSEIQIFDPATIRPAA